MCSGLRRRHRGFHYGARDKCVLVYDPLFCSGSSCFCSADLEEDDVLKGLFFFFSFFFVSVVFNIPSLASYDGVEAL